jgi:hypothetical protein
MATQEELAQMAAAVQTAAGKVKRAKFDGNEIENHNPADVAKALADAASMSAAVNPWGCLRRAQVRPGSAMGETAQ